MRARLGRYELVRLVGRGGGGEVWEAILHGPAGFRRKVALKRLSSAHRDPVLLEGLLHEARLGALVNHPNVVSTLELSQHDGEWFLVMDLVRGRTTSQLRTQGLPAGAVLDVGVQACQGLAHIHGLVDDDGRPLGLVHRDIKPGNLLVDDTGLVRIVDLGIARLVGEPDQPAGTPGYMPPEQLEGHADGRSDLFALGATLVRLATGQRPLGRTLRHLDRLHHVDQLMADDDVRRSVDAAVPGLADVVGRAMRHDPNERYGNAAEMGEALQGLYAQLDDPTRLARVVGATQAGWTPSPAPTYRRGRRIIGRQRELDALARRVTSAGVLVVRGAAGVGKTRLVDHFLLTDLTRPVVRCDLTAVRSLAGLCHAVAEAIGAGIGSDPVPTLGRVLALRPRTLLVLDQADRVAEVVSEALVAWRKAAPTATFLVTSRVALAVPSSVELRIGGLPVADAQALFLQHIRAPHLDDALAEQIVRAVDRLPLAIELAAARARQTSPGAVLDALRLHSPMVLDQHDGSIERSLRASLQASWDLLDGTARDALTRLSSFSNAFDVDDAGAVLAGHHDPVAVLQHLADQSMLQVRDNRFRLLPSIRAFVEVVGPAASRVAGHRLHGRRMALLGAAELTRFGQYGLAHQHKLVRWLDDLVTAHHRAAAAGHDEVASATAIGAFIALMRVGPLELAETLLRTALATGAREHEVRRRLAMVLYNLGRLGDAEAITLEGMARADDLIDDARYRMQLGMIRCTKGTDGLALLEEAWVVQKMAGDPGYAYTLGELGAHYMFANRLSDAEVHLQQAIDAARAVGDPDVAYHQGHLATLYAVRLDLPRAMPLFDETLAVLEAEGRVRLCATYRANYAELLLHVGHVDLARVQADQATEEGRLIGRAPSVAAGLALSSHVARLTGDGARAAQHARGALAELSDRDYDNARVEALLALSAALADRGRPERAARFLRDALDCTGWVFEATRAHLSLLVARWGPDHLQTGQQRWHDEGTLPLTRFFGFLTQGWGAHRAGVRGGARQAALEARRQLAGVALDPTSLAASELRALEEAAT